MLPTAAGLICSDDNNIVTHPAQVCPRVDSDQGVADPTDGVCQVTDDALALPGNHRNLR